MSDLFTEENARQLQDCFELEYILLGDLRDLLEEEPSKETCRWLLAVLQTLLEALPREQALKAEDGYLSDVLEAHPNWAGRVDRLAVEKQQLYDRLHELYQEILHEQTYRNIARQAGEALQAWLDAFVAHQHHERALVQKAINLEVGCGD